jgi:hypothetical protein
MICEDAGGQEKMDGKKFEREVKLTTFLESALFRGIGVAPAFCL